MTKGKSKVVPLAPAAEMQPVLSTVPADNAVTVLFKRDHTHAGVQYQAGDTLVVTREVADLMRLYDAIGGA